MVYNRSVSGAQRKQLPAKWQLLYVLFAIFLLLFTTRRIKSCLGVSYKSQYEFSAVQPEMIWGE